MFVQVNPPSGLGPILIEAIKGSQISRRLGELARDNAFEAMLIGLVETPAPDEHVARIRAQHDDNRLHDHWFEPTGDLIAFIQQNAQHAMQELLAATHPGALSTAHVDIDEMAQILGVSVSTVRRMTKAREIPCLRSGRVLRFVPSEVVASLQRRQR